MIPSLEITTNIFYIFLMMESKYQDITHGLLAPLIHWASCHNGDSGLDVNADIKRVKYECFEENKSKCVLYIGYADSFSSLFMREKNTHRQTACSMQVTLLNYSVVSCSH